MLQKLLGRYNSGFLHFKGDEAGRKCLSWWKEECLKECKMHREKASLAIKDI